MSRESFIGLCLAVGSCATFAWVVEPVTPEIAGDLPAASQVEELVGYLSVCPELAHQIALPLDANEGLLPSRSVQRLREEGRACMAQRARLAEVHRYRLAMAALRDQIAEGSSQAKAPTSRLQLSWSLSKPEADPESASSGN